MSNNTYNKILTNNNMNSKTLIPLTNFLDNNKIKYGVMSCDVSYNYTKQKLDILPPMYWCNNEIYKYNDFNKNKNYNDKKNEFIKQIDDINISYESRDLKTAYLSIDTTNINILDIDKPNIFLKNKKELFDKLENSQSYSSRNSHFKDVDNQYYHRHYFIKVINKPNNKCSFDLKYGDLLCGQSALCKLNNILLNLDKEIIEIDYNELLLKQEIIIKKEIIKNEVITGKCNISIEALDELYCILDDSKFTDYKDWFKYMVLTKTLFGDIGFGIFYKHSLRCTIYSKIDSVEVMKQKYNNLNLNYFGNNPITIGTAYFDAKCNNQKKFNKWIVKYEVKQKSLNELKEEQYEQMKTVFEKNNFYVKTVNAYYSFYDYNKTYIEYDKSNFSNLHCDKIVKIIHNEKEKEYSFFNLWNKDPNKRKYEATDFIPSFNYKKKEIFNLFQGFKLQHKSVKYDQEAVDIYINHIKYITNNDEITGEYLLNYIAHLFQNPQDKPNVAIVIKSIPGCGKDLLIDILSGIFGSKYIARSGDINEQIFGSFNPMLRNKLILQCNEVDSRDGYKNKDKLKHLITADTIQINDKHCKLSSYKNCLRVFIFSNNDNPIYVNCDSRRFFIIEIEKKNTREYYNNLGGLLKNKNALQSIYKYFLSRDITKFEVTNIPETNAKKRMTEYNKPFIFDYIYDNIISSRDYDDYDNYIIDDKKMMLYFNTSEFVKEINRKARQDNIEYKISTKSLSSKLQKYTWCSFLRKTINKKQNRVILIDYNECKKYLESKYKFY